MSGKSTISSSPSSSFPTSNGVSFERYVPKRELPEEIKQLPANETRCQFCGVSYLVHHEVKRLEDLVQELEIKLNKKEEEKQNLLVSIETGKDELAVIEKENKETKERFQSLLIQSLSLLKDTVYNWRTNINDIKKHVQQVMLKDVPLSLQYIQDTCQTSLLALKSVKESENKRHQSIVNDLKIKLTNEEKERNNLRENASHIENRIYQLEKETTDQNEKYQKSEQQLLTSIKQLRETQTELETCKNERVKINEQNKNIDEQLRKERVKNTQLSTELQDIKDKLELLTKDNVLDREQFGKDREHLCDQLLVKDKEINKLKTEIQKEIQAKERMKTEQQELLLKTKTVMERERKSELESLKSQLTKDYDAYRVSSQGKVEQLEKHLLDMSNKHRTDIKELETANHQIKLTLEAEITRHLNEEKTLQLQVEQSHKLLSHKDNKIKQIERQITEIQEKSLQSAIKSQEELQKKQSEYSQSLERQSSEMNKKYLQMEEKLKAAYSEVSTLQSIIERQVNERRKIMEQYNQ